MKKTDQEKLVQALAEGKRVVEASCRPYVFEILEIKDGVAEAYGGEQYTLDDPRVFFSDFFILQPLA